MGVQGEIDMDCPMILQPTFMDESLGKDLNLWGSL